MMYNLTGELLRGPCMTATTPVADPGGAGGTPLFWTGYAYFLISTHRRLVWHLTWRPPPPFQTGAPYPNWHPPPHPKILDPTLHSMVQYLSGRIASDRKKERTQKQIVPPHYWEADICCVVRNECVGVGVRVRLGQES